MGESLQKRVKRIRMLHDIIRYENGLRRTIKGNIYLINILNITISYDSQTKKNQKAERFSELRRR